MKRKDKPHSTWLRCARFVASQYEKAKSSDTESNFDSFGDIATCLDQQQLRLSLTKSRQWKFAEVKAREDYHRQLRKLREHVESELRGEDSSSTFIVDESELFRDLAVLRDEFAGPIYNKKEMRLAVVTKDIALDGLQLGAFRIELHLDSLPAPRPYYEVIAVDANHASSNDCVTHPHVQDNRLCEGDAQPAIKLALKQGRLLDFFQLIEQVLGTYNSSSAYVTIREWDGLSCGNCGQTADPDECYQCAGCESSICDGCVYRCSDCEDCFCGNCDQPCSGCLESVCKSCVRDCCDCDEQLCSDCLTENERCTNCEEKAKENSTTREAEAEIHAKRMGKTALPA
jgi:hypothetical protein